MSPWVSEKGLRPGGVEVPDSALARMQALHDRGLMLQAYDAAREIGPFLAWRGTRAKILAGRMAFHLGGPRLARVLFWRAWREDKENAAACAYHADLISRYHGPLAGWDFLKSVPDPTGEVDRDVQVYLVALRATLAAQFRDFERAEMWLNHARMLGEQDPWLAVAESYVYESQDRYEAALKAAQRGLRLRPLHRPSIQATVHALQLLDRDEEAVSILQEACRRMESGALAAQLAALQKDLGQYREAWASYDRYVELSPILETRLADKLRRARVSMACASGALDKALELAGQIDESHSRDVAARLRQTGRRWRRVRLEVPFVRQHHLTCVPATFSALSRFWQRPVEHLELAEQICYHGTPAHAERRWAENHGWFVREFTLTWESAVALLDRGLPFMLTTCDLTSAHMQALIGYDEVQEKFLIRDPYEYYEQEVFAKPFLEHYRATGPLCLVAVPAEKAGLLAGLELPDTGLFDKVHRFQSALDEHRRDKASAVLEELRKAAPSHWLTLSARRALASYDGNVPELLECLDKLLEQFPKDGLLNLSKYRCLRDLNRREDRLVFLEKLCLQKDTDPAFWVHYGQELSCDARERAAARYWLEKALRARPLTASFLQTSAHLLMDEGRYHEAMDRYRLAACLDDKEEDFSQSLFAASRFLKQTDRALDFLRRRWIRFQHSSALPGMTYFQALCRVNRTEEAFAVLDSSMKARPEDGSLRLFAADACAHFRKNQQAEQFLQEAAGKVHRSAWLETAAQLAQARGDRSAALALWREVLQLQPLNLSANRAAAQLHAEIKGPRAALEFLQKVCQRFPYQCELHRLWIAWLRDEGMEKLEPVLRHLLAVNPADAWAERELALALEPCRRLEEGLAAVNRAIALEPETPAGYGIRGTLLARSGRLAEAKADFREAIRRAVDTVDSIHGLVGCCQTLAEKKEELGFVARELVRQVVFGPGIFAFRRAASGILDRQETLALLQEGLRARPDLWQTWSAVVQQLVDVGLYEEAFGLVQEANRKFPLVMDLWMNRARVHRARGEPQEELQALVEATAMAPEGSDAPHELAEACWREGQFDKARAVLDTACVRAPLVPSNHAHLASILWRSDEKKRALNRIHHALRLDPWYEWAQDQLRIWAQESGRPGLAVKMARRLAKEHPGVAQAWLFLAQSLLDIGHVAEAESAVDQALERNPRDVAVHHFKANMLADAGRYEEALACCVPTIFPTIPIPLRAKAAAIQAQRGHLAKAIEEMESVVADAPDLYWGWTRLAEWYVDAKAVEKALDATRRMSELNPLSPIPHGYSGAIKLDLGDRPGAKKDLRLAFSLDPTYLFAGFKLFDLQLDDLELAEAARTLQLLNRHGGRDQSALCEARLALKQADHQRVEEILQEACCSPTIHGEELFKLASLLTCPRHRRRVAAVLRQAAHRPDANPVLGEVWVRYQMHRGKWHLLPELNRLQAQGEIGRRALAKYVECLGDKMDAWHGSPVSAKGKGLLGFLQTRRWFRRLLRRHREHLRSDDLMWGCTGYALVCARAYETAIQWLADWEQRSRLQGWQLFNLMSSLQVRRRHAEALQLLRRGPNRLAKDDPFLPTLKVWAALEEGLSGEAIQAELLLSGIALDDVAPMGRPIYKLAQTVLNTKKAGPADRSGTAQRARELIREGFASIRPHRFARPVRMTFRRTVRWVAKTTQNRQLRIWGLWFYRGKSWFAVLLWSLAGLGLLLILAGLAHAAGFLD